jgi:hypothetical protein
MDDPFGRSSTTGDLTIGVESAHMDFRSAIAAAALAATFVTLAAPAHAQSASPAASPSPAATPSAPQDPCGSILSIVNRPTIGTGVCTVRDGHADVEIGYANATTTGAGGGQTANYPQAFLRAGIGRHAEFNFTPPSYAKTSLGGPIVTGSTDMAIGAKWELGYTSKALWGANVQISGATGTPAFTAGGTQYTGNLNWGYTLSSVWGVNGTLGFNSFVGANLAGNAQRYGAFVPTFEATATLPQNQELFGEYAYFSHAAPGLGGKSVLDFGYIRDLGDRWQFDVEYGFQPTVVNGQKMHYAGAGLSFMN